MSDLRVEKYREDWAVMESSFIGKDILKAYDNKKPAVKEARRIAKNRLGRNRLTIETSTGIVQEQVTYRNGKPIKQ